MPRLVKDWLILICIGIIAVLAFRERAHWASPQSLPAASVLPGTPLLAPNLLPEPRSESSPPKPPADVPPAPAAPGNRELANLIAQSQQKAVEKYPALGVANSEINIRFAFRHKHLLEDRSSRLQDPAWPLELADECARASGIVPATQRASTKSPVVASQTTALTLAAAQPANSAAPSLRAPPSAAATAQTLVFHPANVNAPPLGAAAGPAPFAAPKPANSLPFITMEAVNQKSANNYTYNWGYDYGWYDISFRQSVGVAINVKNMSRDAAAVNLRWIFFARQSRGNDRFVFAASGKELESHARANRFRRRRFSDASAPGSERRLAWSAISIGVQIRRLAGATSGTGKQSNHQADRFNELPRRFGQEDGFLDHDRRLQDEGARAGKRGAVRPRSISPSIAGNVGWVRQA